MRRIDFIYVRFFLHFYPKKRTQKYKVLWLGMDISSNSQNLIFVVRVEQAHSITV